MLPSFKTLNKKCIAKTQQLGETIKNNELKHSEQLIVSYDCAMQSGLIFRADSIKYAVFSLSFSLSSYSSHVIFVRWKHRDEVMQFKISTLNKQIYENPELRSSNQMVVQNKKSYH